MARTSNSEPPTPMAEGKRILIVEDEIRIAKLIATVLATHDVALASSGREAMARLDRGEKFDLLLCDLMMPEGSGMDLHAHVCAHHAALEPRMVFMTGGGFTARAAAFLASLDRGRCIEKPFLLDQLLALVEEHLRR